MKTLLARAVALAAALTMLAAPAFAQGPVVQSPSGAANTQSLVYGDVGSPGTTVKDATGLPIRCMSGCASPVPFSPVGQAALAVTTSSARVAFPSAGTAVLVNNGSTDVAFKLGTSSVTAATTDIFLGAGRVIVIATDANTHIAAITASGTSSIQITTGTGNPTVAGGGGGGGGSGGAVTIIDGGDVAQGDKDDLTCTTDTGSCTVVQLIKRNNERLTTLDGRVDGIEALLTTLNGKIDLANASLDDIETSAESTTPADTNDAQLLGNATAAGAGNVNSGTKRMTLGDDSPGIGSFGSTFPVRGRAVGAKEGANMAPISQGSATAPINISSATTLQIVGLQSGQSIRVTAIVFTAAGTTTSKFVYGTGTNCGTGTTDIHPAMSWTAQTGLSSGGGLGPIMVVPAGQALCITDTAAVQIAGWLTYTQY